LFNRNLYEIITREISTRIGTVNIFSGKGKPEPEKYYGYGYGYPKPTRNRPEIMPNTRNRPEAEKCYPKQHYCTDIIVE
jgi:hypothetical protein